MKPKTAAKSDSTHPERQNESTHERVLEAAFTGMISGKDLSPIAWQPITVSRRI